MSDAITTHTVGVQKESTCHDELCIYLYYYYHINISRIPHKTANITFSLFSRYI